MPPQTVAEYLVPVPAVRRVAIIAVCNVINENIRGLTRILLLTFVLAAAASHMTAAELPRKVRTPRETYPDADVMYDAVTMPNGLRVRTIITRPHGVADKVPVIFVAGWLSCDSIEAPENTKEETSLLFRQLAQLPRFSLVRVDKPGVGDSEGVCAETDFQTELAGYRAAFRALKNYDFIDANRVYMLGISNGGGFAPIVPETAAEQARVRGYVVVGGWIKTWLEHMLEIERRRFGLMDKTPGEVNTRMKGAARLYEEWLIAHRRVQDIVAENASLADLWPDGKDRAHLYGRQLAFYEQLQDLNLAEAWSRVEVPALVLHGQFDWIMSREDHELIAAQLNGRKPGSARFVEVPHMGHTLQTYSNFADAFAGKSAGLQGEAARMITDWLLEQSQRR